MTPPGSWFDLHAWLRTAWDATPRERVVQLGYNERVPCRLLAMRVPERVAQSAASPRALDHARSKGRTPSDRGLAWCDWTVLVTKCRT